MVELPEAVKRLIEAPNLAHFVTLMPSGSPQVTPLWVDHDGTHVLVNTAEGRQKPRNLRRDPRIGMTITAAGDPWNKADVRGRVVGFVEGEEADAHIDDLAEKYIGQRPYPWRQPDEKRVIVVIEPERVYEM